MNVVYIVIGGLAAVVLFSQLRVLWHSHRQKGKPAPELSGPVGEAIAAGGKVLIYFWSSSCRMCLPMTPLIDKLGQEFRDVFKFNVIKEMEIACRFGIKGTPQRF